MKDFFYNEFDLRLGEVVDSVKMLLYKRHEDIFERIDFYNDNIFLEPLLYTYLTQKDNEWLDSIIVGYEKKPKRKINVFTNKLGIVYIPNIGYFTTKKNSKMLKLEILSQEEFIMYDGMEKIDFIFEPLCILENEIELIKTQHPLIEKFFIKKDNKKEAVKIESIFEKHINHFNKAYNIIKEYYRSYFDLLHKNVKKVMIYEGESNSFASIQVHNMIFLNTKNHDDEVFFLDHILHEGAHVIFNTLTYKTKHNLFTVPFNSLLKDFIGNAEEHGEVYGRFHGLFTQSNINSCMKICLEKKVFSGKQEHELIGRFSSNLKRFKNAIYTFNNSNLYTEEGSKWYEFFEKKQKTLYNSNRELIDKYNVSNQPYVFSYKIFSETNPLNS
ncbi:hypothetical protein [Chishuiella sp.]|uniref:hypothetical protein n=1 Tax=Chishuiella sp. TaxID=1969467 RepID=UPI0028A8E4ED|nr:hypothetical protein [Chishuiella sp.]